MELQAEEVDKTMLDYISITDTWKGALKIGLSVPLSGAIDAHIYYFPSWKKPPLQPPNTAYG